MFERSVRRSDRLHGEIDGAPHGERDSNRTGRRRCLDVRSRRPHHQAVRRRQAQRGGRGPNGTGIESNALTPILADHGVKTSGHDIERPKKIVESSHLRRGVASRPGSPGAGEQAHAQPRQPDPGQVEASDSSFHLGPLKGSVGREKDGAQATLG